MTSFARAAMLRLVQDAVTARQLLQLLSTVGDGAARDFATTMRAEVEAMPQDVLLDVTRGSTSPSLHHIYSFRRQHLAERGVDVRGLDALLAAIEDSPEGTGIGFVVVKSAEANIIAVCDRDVRLLLGWAVVPLDLPSLDDVRAGRVPPPGER